METIVKNYFDDETLEHVGTRYFVDKEEVNFEEYVEIIEAIIPDKVDESEDNCACGQDCNCENCYCDECPGCDNVECCEENREYEDEELEQQCDCDCLICQAEQEVQELDCFCEECNEDYMQEFIDECLEHVFNGCPDCTIESVIKLAFKCKELGVQSVKQKMREFLDD